MSIANYYKISNIRDVFLKPCVQKILYTAHNICFLLVLSTSHNIKKLPDYSLQKMFLLFKIEKQVFYTDGLCDVIDNINDKPINN